MSSSQLLSIIDSLKEAKVLVVGDIMLDQYIYGDTNRISPEAPVPVVKKLDHENKPGGAGNVALNIKKLGAEVSLLGMCGDDPEASILQDYLEKHDIKSHLIRIELPTIKKTRVLSKHQQLLRIDTEISYTDIDHTALLNTFNQLILNYDAVLLSDYAKGTLSPILPQLIDISRSNNIVVLVDPKESDLSAYKNANWITPNLKEFLAGSSSDDSDAELESRASQLISENNFDGILLTRSEKGMSLYSKQIQSVNLPTQVREVFDVTGAGDTVISVLATGLAIAADMPSIMKLANIAAGIVVGKMGAAYVTPTELSDHIHLAELDTSSRTMGIVDIKTLLQEIIKSRSIDETVVFTNGCFDILHSGHVTYLEEARSLGDRLIVAVNSDKSVKLLKGDKRPVMPLQQRMHILSALKSVDWVISFEQETPEELICKTLPDVLVKGGDYQVEEIAGHQCVIDNNGKVLILSFINDISTSNIINKVLETH